MPVREANFSRAGSSASVTGAPYIVPKPPASSRMQLGPRTKQTARKSGYRPSSSSGDDYDSGEDENYNRVYYDGHEDYSNDYGEDSQSEDYDSYDDQLENEGHDDDDDDPPPPYPGSPRPEPQPMDWVSTPASSNRASAPLGLLNGRYGIVHSDTPPGYKPTSPHAQIMTLTLDGDALWMRFDLGFLDGVGRTDRRPYETSRRRTFGWFGFSAHYREVFTGGGVGGNADGAMDARLEFVGGGVVRGEVDWINWQTTCFEAHRLDGQGTRSDISARDMRGMFEQFRLGLGP